LRADLATGLHQRRRTAGRRVGFRSDRRVCLHRTLRGYHNQELMPAAVAGGGATHTHCWIANPPKLGETPACTSSRLTACSAKGLLRTETLWVAFITIVSRMVSRRSLLA